MARVIRGNVVLHVKDEEVQHYLNLGYNLTDKSGKVVKVSIPSDVPTLQSAYVKHIKKIDELEATIAKLTAELNTSKPKESKDAPEPVVEEAPTETAIEDKPKAKSKAKKSAK